MPLINVNEVLSDGFVAAEAFTVVRQAFGVDQYGNLQISATPIVGPTVYGSITPSSDNRLQRQKDYEAGNSSITVITPFRLQGPSRQPTVPFTQYGPDLVVWNRSIYVVSDLKDWSRYGAGFIEAICTQQSFVGPPPGASFVGITNFSFANQSDLIGALEKCC